MIVESTMSNRNMDIVAAKDGSDGIPASEGERIQVFLRLRPMNKLELFRRSKNCIVVHPYNFHKKQVTVDSHLDGEHEFSFDEVFEEVDSDQLVYDRAVSPLASKFMDGYNVALVAFGQAKSGKSRLLLGKKIALKANKNSTTSHSEVENNAESDRNDDASNSISHDGIVEQLSHDLFQRMKETSEEVEFTVKISYIEIYLEHIRDLLNPKRRFLKIKETDELIDEYNLGQGALPKIEGLSEICCVSGSDIIALVKRGHAYRVVGEERKQTDLARSHTILSIKIEQKNLITEKTITSTFVIANTASNEVDGTKERHSTLSNNSPSFRQKKALAEGSFSALDRIVKSLESDNMSPKPLEAVKEPTLTKILTGALGGNSHCSFLLTASPASTSINETLNSMRFGKRLRRITNYPTINVQPSPRECIIELEKSKKIQSELLRLVNEVNEEVQKVKGKTSHMPLEPDIWNALNEICSKNKYCEQDPFQNINVYNANMPVCEELKLEKEKVDKLKERIENIMDSKDMAQNAVDMLQGECLFLRRESDEVLQAKKKNTIDLIECQNEIQTLNQRRLQDEHKLRTTKFRENEAVSFLRHFRRFYRRLLENVHAQGSGDLASIMSQMIGAPDLGSLIDIDKLLMASGFLEFFEVGQEIDTHDNCPSSAALQRSSTEAERSRCAALPHGSRESDSLVQQLKSTSIAESKPFKGNTTSSLDNSESLINHINAANILTTPFAIKMTLDPSNTPDVIHTSPELSSRKRNQRGTPCVVLSPAAQLSERRVEELEMEVLTMTQRCMELQTKLNNTEERLEVLTLKPNIIKKHQSAREVIDLKAMVAKKEADLEAVVWKMNELHLVNRSYNDRVSNRDQYINYLEESLRSDQDSNVRLVSVHIENDKKLRNEADRLNRVIDSLTTQLWQEGAVQLPLESRIIVPFQGSLQSNYRIENIIDRSDDHQNIEVRDTRDTERNDNEARYLTPLISVELSRKFNLDALLKGGKSNDYVPRRFAEKRGRTIQSATTSSYVTKVSSLRSFGRIPRSFSGDSRDSDSLDLITVREQINQLDLLTKSWRKWTTLPANE